MGRVAIMTAYVTVHRSLSRKGRGVNGYRRTARERSLVAVTGLGLV
jgi:hypothetical protein